MSWVSKYWDTIDQLYWDPSLLGLASIPKAEWKRGEFGIAVPSERVRNGGSIYTRKGTAVENAERMRRLEEPLNHIFDIAFGIAPDEAIQLLFLAPLQISDPGPFLRLGREVAARYSGFANSNTTQQDGFFVGPQSLVGVELKVGSKTWRGQALKYLALMVAEEKRSGERERLGLLYITPAPNEEATFAQTGAGVDGRLPPDFIEMVPKHEVNRSIREMVTGDRAHFDDAVARLKVGHTSWHQVAMEAQSLADQQDGGTAAGQTYRNLLIGLADAIVSQSGCC